MKHLKSFGKEGPRTGDAILAVLRGVLGLVLLWKAAEFYMNRSELMEIIAGAGEWWFAPAAWAHYVILAHCFGGFCLLMGIATRFACFVQLPILLGAIFYVHLPVVLQGNSADSLGELNLAVLVLGALLFYNICGAGVYSLDYYTALDEDGEPGKDYGHHYPSVPHESLHRHGTHHG